MTYLATRCLTKSTSDLFRRSGARWQRALNAHGRASRAVPARDPRSLSKDGKDSRMNPVTRQSKRIALNRPAERLPDEFGQRRQEDPHEGPPRFRLEELKPRW